jgi:hypothetical protein
MFHILALRNIYTYAVNQKIKNDKIGFIRFKIHLDGRSLLQPSATIIKAQHPNDDCKSDRPCRSIQIYDTAYFIIVHMFISYVSEHKAFKQTTLLPWRTRHTLALS